MLLLAASTAFARAIAGEDPEQLIRVGNDLRGRGDDQRAEGYFRRAYELARTPRTAVQLGLVELALDKYVDAERHLSEGLASDDSWVRAHGKLIETSRDEARRHLLRVRLMGAPEGTTAALGPGNGRPVPEDGVLWLPSGASTIRLERRTNPTGAPVTVTISGDAGDSREVDVRALTQPPPQKRPVPPVLVTKDVAAVPQAAPAGRNLYTAGVSAIAVGAAMGVAGGFVLWEGNHKRNTIEAATALYDPADGNWRTWQTAGGRMIVAGAGSVAVGAALWLWSAASARATAANSALSVDAGPTLAVVNWEGRF
jgi:hypothetical protein